MNIEDAKSKLQVVPKDRTKIRQIWKTAIILLLITVGEFILAFTIDEENYSQPTYCPDIFVDFPDEFWIIDAKSDAWNNNTPVSDTVKKYKLSKQEIEKNTEKKVRFIILKNTKDSNHLTKISNEAIKSGVEIIITNDFLSKIFNKTINIDEITEEFMMEKIREKLAMF